MKQRRKTKKAVDDAAAPTHLTVITCMNCGKSDSRPSLTPSEIFIRFCHRGDCMLDAPSIQDRIHGEVQKEAAS